MAIVMPQVTFPPRMWKFAKMEMQLPMGMIVNKGSRTVAKLKTIKNEWTQN